MLSILTLHFNDPRPTLELVESLTNHVEVHILDNSEVEHASSRLLLCLKSIGFIELVETGGSTSTELPSCMGRLRRGSVKITVWSDGINLGFAAGVNRLIQTLTHPEINDINDIWFIVNNDCKVSPSLFRSIQQFTSAVDSAKPFIASPTILTNDGEVWYSGGDLSWLRLGGRHHRVHSSDGLKHELTDYVTGCALVLNRALIHFLDGKLFDPYYFFSAEDVALNIKLKKFKILRYKIVDSIQTSISASSGGELGTRGAQYESFYRTAVVRELPAEKAIAASVFIILNRLYKLAFLYIPSRHFRLGLKCMTLTIISLYIQAFRLNIQLRINKDGNWQFMHIK